MIIKTGLLLKINLGIMKRKADFKQETISKKDLEHLFTAIKVRFDEQDELITRRFDEQDKKMQAILEIVRIYDIERKEVKSTLWEHDRRLLKLEKQLS